VSYREGTGGPVDPVQALRWFLAMLGTGNGDGIHEAHEMVPHMDVEQVREAARLAGQSGAGERLLELFQH
jgi:TPR repeat protein